MDDDWRYHHSRKPPNGSKWRSFPQARFDLPEGSRALLMHKPKLHGRRYPQTYHIYHPKPSYRVGHLAPVLRFSSTYGSLAAQCSHTLLRSCCAQTLAISKPYVRVSADLDLPFFGTFYLRNEFVLLSLTFA